MNNLWGRLKGPILAACGIGFSCFILLAFFAAVNDNILAPLERSEERSENLFNILKGINHQLEDRGYERFSKVPYNRQPLDRLEEISESLKALKYLAVLNYLVTRDENLDGALDVSDVCHTFKLDEARLRSLLD